MKEIKRDVTESKIFYEISEDELRKIKGEERAKGRADVARYIDYCCNNFIYKLSSISSIFELLKQIIFFIRRKRDGIDNIYEIDFFDWVEKYR